MRRLAILFNSWPSISAFLCSTRGGLATTEIVARRAETPVAQSQGFPEPGP